MGEGRRGLLNLGSGFTCKGVDLGVMRGAAAAAADATAEAGVEAVGGSSNSPLRAGVCV